MTRKIAYNPSEANQIASEVAETLASGGIVCLPTDTVYGLIWRYEDSLADQRVREMKGREDNKPFALFTDNLARILCLNVAINNSAKKIILNYWPGALTVVLSTTQNMHGEMKGKIGVRCPNHDLIRAVIGHFDGFVLNTSFNESGHHALLSVPEGFPLLEKVDLFIDAGTLPESLASTVIDCSNDTIKLLREGAIRFEEILTAANR